MSASDPCKKFYRTRATLVFLFFPDFDENSGEMKRILAIDIVITDVFRCRCCFFDLQIFIFLLISSSIFSFGLPLLLHDTKTPMAASVPDVFSNFYLVKSQKIANNKATTEVREKSTSLESLE